MPAEGAWLDGGRLGAERGDPRPPSSRKFLARCPNEDTAIDEQIGQHVDHLGRVQLALRPDHQAPAAELVDQFQRAELGAFMYAALYKGLWRLSCASVNLPW